MEKEELIEAIDDFLVTQVIDDACIAFILVNKDNEYKAVIYRESDPDEIHEINIVNNTFELHDIFDWDFNVDTHLFEELQNGYNIYHMPYDSHMGVWFMVNNLRDEINNKDGLQLYLKYCQNNEIT